MRLTTLVVGLSIAAFGCEGPAGPSGSDGEGSLVSTGDESPGSNCEYGGTKVDVGVDSDGDGTLDPTEVMHTTYVCNGAGTNALVATTSEPAGTNCPFGGTKIETGLDVNNNGELDAAEVNAAATSYVCVIGPSGALSPSTGIVAAVKIVSSTSPVTVRFTLKDDRGFPLDLNGMYSVNTPIQPRFTLARFTKDARDQVTPYTVYTKSGATPMPTMYSPLGAAGSGTLVENGFAAGDYTYTFPSATTTNGSVGVAFDATAMDETHVVWIQVTRQTDLAYQINANTFSASNVPYYFVPSGTGTPLERELVKPERCDSCHNKFKAETTASAQFHGGGRVDPRMCNVCHNPARTSNPLANSASFVHRIHNSEQVATANLWHGIDITYPQDTRNCATCHSGAQQGAQAHTNPSVIACKGCHDYVAFDDSASVTCGVTTGPGTGPVRGSDGKPVACNHFAGAATGPVSDCASCHGSTGAFPDTKFHVPVAAPDPNNLWLTGGTNANTNASYVASGGFVPAAADVITYDVATVDTVLDTSVIPNVKRPRIKFKFKNNGTDVVFQTYAAGSVTEMMPNFVGSPSAYFAFAMPQDGNATPADFNASVGGYIKNIWNGTATGSAMGMLTGPDGSGYYTLTLTKVQIPASATMLTGGIGYTYSLSSAPPLVQTNLQAFPWTPNVPADGKAQGGLSVPAPNVWKVATDYTPRRPLVETARCNNCHGRLGVTPSFHAGQRNDGPTCSFCHTPNKTSAGWSAGSKYFIHAIHAGRKRVVNFTWHAAQKGPGYDEIEFPGTLNQCTNCHAPNTYDFTNAPNLGALPNEELYTVATGKYDTNPLTNSAYYTVSPYVIADGVYDYGAGYAFNASTGATTEAAPTTLVISQVTGACAACHDAPAAINHMTLNGGLFYAPRSTATGPGAQPEQCLICHGPGRTAAIGAVHQR
ncbi:MAG TPA: OmcA/MtrC family decaheme c-type cytochrome [Kofleriaceae bacterium]|nr:OmcA/MtrC family decaheme c-type cytochrome [Kofleriaceae bacterium]